VNIIYPHRDNGMTDEGVALYRNELDVRESMHRDTTMKITNKMHSIG
jgi:hypothetical protein